MTPNEYQQLALKTEKTPLFIAQEDGSKAGPVEERLARIFHGAMGITTEAGELFDALKKHLIYGKPLDLTNVMEECGDVLWYVALTLHAAGYSMELAMERNLAKLKARFGDKFTEQAALNRNLPAERKQLERQHRITPEGLTFPGDTLPRKLESVMEDTSPIRMLGALVLHLEALAKQHPEQIYCENYKATAATLREEIGKYPIA